MTRWDCGWMQTGRNNNDSSLDAVCLHGVMPECGFSSTHTWIPHAFLFPAPNPTIVTVGVANESGTVVHDRKLHPLCNGSHDSCADFDDEQGPCVKMTETRVLLASVNVLWLRFKVPWESSAASELIDLESLIYRLFFFFFFLFRVFRFWKRDTFTSSICFRTGALRSGPRSTWPAGLWASTSNIISQNSLPRT